MKRKLWSDQEIDFLKQNSDLTVNELSLRLNKHISVIYRKLHKLNIVIQCDRWFTKENKQFIHDNINKMTVRQISNQIGCKAVTIYRYISSNHIEKKDFQKKWTKKEIDFLVNNAYNMSVNDICLHLSKSRISVKNKKNQLGLKHKTYSNIKLYSDDTFFKTPNLTNSYWAGFIAGDGHLSINGVIIRLAIKDIALLQKFKIDIKSEHKLAIYKRSSSKKDVVSLNICNKNIKQDLINNFNIPSKNKSKTINPPIKLSDDNFAAYLVGLIDADGWICYNKINKLVFGICGAYKLMKFCSDFIYKKYNIRLNVIKHSTIFCISTSGKKAEFIRDNLSRIITPFKLPRKWESKPNVK